MGFVQYHNMSEADRAEQERQRELFETLKRLEQWQACIRTELEILIRTKALTTDHERRIGERGAEYGECFAKIMGAYPRVDNRGKIVGTKR